MKIIVFTYNIPRPDRSSGEKRFVAILELLAKDLQVDLCLTRFYNKYLEDEYQKYIPELYSKGINVLPIRKGIVSEVLKKQKYDIAFFEFFWIAEENIFYLWKYQPEAKIIIDSVDVHFAREESQAKLGQVSWKKVKNTRKRELKIYRNADITLTVSQEDQAILKEQYHINNVLFMPNIVPSVPRKPGLRNPVALFIGSFLWPPNVDAMKWFTTEIWPKVYNQMIGVKFQIIGNAPSPEILALADIPGVEVLGYVPETASYLESAAISVAPLRYGGGMKGKINEALAYGVPVVTTSIGAQGFHPENGKEMIIADDPDQFAAAMINLLENHERQEKIGIAGQQLNERLCSPAVVKALLKDMIDLAKSIPRAESKRLPVFKIFLWKMRAMRKKLFEIIQYHKIKIFIR